MFAKEAANPPLCQVQTAHRALRTRLVSARPLCVPQPPQREVAKKPTTYSALSLLINPRANHAARQRSVTRQVPQALTRQGVFADYSRICCALF